MIGYTRLPHTTNTPAAEDLIQQHQEMILDNIDQIDTVGFFPDDEQTLLDTLTEGLAIVRNTYNAATWDFQVGGQTRTFVIHDENNPEDDDLFLPAESEIFLIFNLINTLPEIGAQLGILGEGIITT